MLCDHFMENFPDKPPTHVPDQALVKELEMKFAEHIEWVNKTFFDGREVYGVGGQLRPKHAGDGSIEMNDNQVWREVAQVLATSLLARFGQNGRRKIEQLLADGWVESSTLGAGGASMSPNQREGEMAWVIDALFCGRNGIDRAGEPTAGAALKANEDQVWRRVALLLAKEFSERLGKRSAGQGSRGQSSKPEHTAA